MKPKFKIELAYIRQLIFRLLLMLGIFSLCRICFYYFNQDSFPSIDLGSFSSILLYGLRFDIAAIVYINSLLFLSYLLPFSFRENKVYKKAQKVIFLFTNSFALFLEFVDIGFFEFAVRRSIGSDLTMILSTASLAPKYILEYWYLLLVLIVFILFMSWLYNKVSINTGGKKNFISQLFLFLLGIGMLIIGARGGLQLRPVMPITAAEYVDDIRLIPLVTNTSLGLIFSSQQRFVKAKHYFTEKELDQEFSILQNPKPTAPFKKENVFIIVLESFGKESISFYNPKAKTPFLDSVIKNAWHSKNSFANGLRSTQGIVSITSGVPALMEDPLMFSAYQSNQLNGIASLLKSKNYTSAFFHGANVGSMEFERFSKVAGFDHYYDRSHYPDQNDYDENWGIWDVPYFQYVAKEVEKMKEPFFALTFSLTSHHPYHVEKSFEQKYPEMDIVDRSILYTDYALQQFFEKAKQMPWFDHTLFVICADHVGMRREKIYKTKVNTFGIPILFYKSDSSFAKNSDQLISQVDILPSIMDYLHYDKPFTSFGTSVFDTSKQNYAYMYTDGIYQVLDKDYVLFFDEQKTLGLYQYHNDPFLKKDLSDHLPKIKNRLERKIKAALQRHHEAMISNKLSSF